MTQSELDERNKTLIIDNNRMKRIVDETNLIHYKSISKEAAENRYKSLVEENKNLKNKLYDIYDL